MTDNHIPLHLIDTYYCNDDVADLWEEGDDRTDEISHMRSLVRCLSDINIEIYTRLMLEGLTQETVADSLDIKQSSVASRVLSIVKAMKYLTNIPTISKSCVKRNLAVLTPTKLKYVKAYMATPVQVVLAQQFSVSPSNITQAITHTLDNAKVDDEFKTYLRYILSPPKTIHKLPFIL